MRGTSRSGLEKNLSILSPPCGIRYPAPASLTLRPSHSGRALLSPDWLWGGVGIEGSGGIGRSSISSRPGPATGEDGGQPDRRLCPRRSCGAKLKSRSEHTPPHRAATQTRRQRVGAHAHGAHAQPPGEAERGGGRARRAHARGLTRKASERLRGARRARTHRAAHTSQVP